MSKPTAIGVYIYAGGFSVGVKRAGFDIPAHFEEGTFGTLTAKNNLKVATHEDPATWPTREWRDRVQFVHSNPPCAPWSNAGKVIDGKRGAAFAGDSRLGCVEKSFEAAMAMRSRAWAWESVSRTPVLAAQYVEDLAARAKKHGDYETTVFSLDAAHVGAPQWRRRAFVVVHDFPLELKLDQRYVDKPRTVREAWRDEKPADTPRPNVSPTTLKWLAKVPQGGKLNKEYNRIFKVDPDARNVVGRPGFLQRRLAWDKPAFTITGGAHHYHPTEQRYVSVHESAVLCGYPAKYEFTGGTSSQYAQVGKGVTVQAGEWLARGILDGIKRQKTIEQPGRVNHVDLLRRVGTDTTQKEA